MKRGFERGYLPWIIALLLLLTVVRGPCRHNLNLKRPWVPEAPPSHVEVVKALDGDTLLTSTAEKVRMIGIDAPEIGQPFAEEAKNFLNTLLRGKKVRLVYEIETRDRYGRILADVFLPTKHGELFVAEELLRRGLAELYLVPPNLLYKGRLLSALREAFLKKRGVWSLPVEPAPFYVSGKWRFHRPNCPHVREIPNPTYTRRRDILILQGKGRCRTCRP